MDIFLDTNVLLDAYLNRPGAVDCARVIKACAEPWNRRFVALHTLSNAFYLISKYRGQSAAWKLIDEVLAWATVPAVDMVAIKRTCQMEMSDFEDALQIVSAEACGAELIVTRNTRDFLAKTRLRVVVPEDFVDQSPR